MQAATIKQAEKTYENITHKWSGFFYDKTPVKTVSVMKQVILVTTDKKTVKESEKILDDLNKVISSLPSESSKVDIDKCKNILKINNVNLLGANSFIDLIDSIFDHSSDKVAIDDVHMQTVVCNLKSAQEKMKHISDYLQVIVDIAEAQKGTIKSYTFDELVSVLEAA